MDVFVCDIDFFSSSRNMSVECTVTHTTPENVKGSIRDVYDELGDGDDDELNELLSRSILPNKLTFPILKMEFI